MTVAQKTMGNGQENEIHVYILTDGEEVFTQKTMTEEEAIEENRVASRHTSGNIYWTIKTDSN